jgi:hypothetical protein
MIEFVSDGCAVVLGVWTVALVVGFVSCSGKDVSLKVTCFALLFVIAFEMLLSS